MKNICLTFILALTLTNQVVAQQVTPMSLEDKLKKVDNITLGRVTDFREVNGTIQGQPEVCGYSVEIEVLRALRGREENYTTFVAAGNPPMLGERYLLASSRNPIFAKQGDEAYTYCQMVVPDGEGTSLPENGAVDLSNFIFTTRGPTGGFYGVDPYLARKLGGDWLMDVPGSHDRSSDAYVEEDENPLHPNAYTGTDFLGFLQQYFAIISAPKVD